MHGIKQVHHNIPISLFGEDTPQNKFETYKNRHQELHDTQNVPYSHIRRFKEKTNGILVPNNYVIDGRVDIWREYFSKANDYIFEQKQSLAKQIARYNSLLGVTSPVSGGMDFDDYIFELGSVQKAMIKQIISGHLK